MNIYSKTFLTTALLTAGLLLGGCATVPDLSHFVVLRTAPQTVPAPPPAPVNLVRRGPPPAPAPAPVLVSRTVSEHLTVGFPFGGFRPQDSTLAVLDALAQKIKALPVLEAVQITGYADSIGTPRDNGILSLWRALAVKALLIARGVPKDKITAMGAGATDFVVSPALCRGNLHARAACQAPNRRVEITVTWAVQILVPGR